MQPNEQLTKAIELLASSELTVTDQRLRLLIWLLRQDKPRSIRDMVFDLQLSGMGLRKTLDLLTEKQLLTVSVEGRAKMYQLSLMSK
jgi:Fe2+ or Zn2+ uptake regulation protein